MTPNLYDGLIFDLDGTLWDSTLPVAQAWNRALHSLGMRQLSRKDIEGIMGMPHQKILETLFPDEGEARREEIAQLCYAEEVALLKEKGAALFPGVVEGLPILARRFPLFIVSNCQTDYLDTFYLSTGFKKLFRDDECHGRTGRSKAENIALVKKRNKLRAPAYIGDTGSDQQAATRAGVDYFHVMYGFGRPSRDCVGFADFDQLVEYFNGETTVL
jgi:phosphoglycolate phosphatase